MGIDLSYSSTGIAVCESSEARQVEYHLISSGKLSKKARNWADNQSVICYHFYEHADTPCSMDYSQREQNKAHNAMCIMLILKDIIEEIRPDFVVLEGSIYGMSSSAMDMAGLQMVIRVLLACMNVPFEVVTPKHLKTVSVGTPKGKKEHMLEVWRVVQSVTAENLPVYVKSDDLADAYFLAQYGNVLKLD